MLKWKTYLFVAWTTLGLTGAVMFGAAIRHNTQHSWYLVRTPLAMKAGERIDVDFVAELDERHELELRFSRSAPREVLRKYIYPRDKPAPLDIDWTLMGGEFDLLQGQASDYLYVYEPNWKRRIWNFAVRAPNQYGLFPGQIGRGIGSFSAKAGEHYTLSLQVNEGVEALQPHDPELVVRVSRRSVLHHYQKMVNSAGAGLVFLSASALCFCLWVILLWVRGTAPAPIAAGTDGD